jgi:hypothetical protein
MSDLLLPMDDSPLAFGQAGGVSMAEVLEHLKALRIPFDGLEEVALRDAVYDLLRSRGVPCKKEFCFVPGSRRWRADIWVDGIVIELKKQRPRRAEVAHQLGRYAATGWVRGLVLVLERHVPLPDEIGGVPCAVVSMNSLWGIAV